jgi:peptidoglycan-associated lipoprotein
VGLAVVVLTIVPACKSKKTKGPIVAPQDTMVPPQITIPPNTTTTETPVPSPTDFVRDPEPVVTTTQLPTNIEDLNRVAMDRGYIQDAFFGYDESTLSSEAQGALTVSANWLKQNPRYNLLIEGHTDERGTTQYNLALGDRRANIVKDYLSTLGVDAARLRTVSYGEEKPFDPDHDESAYAKNRRAHLVIVGQ